MLHYNTVDATTLELLISLQKLPVFSELRLVGGTSLALQIGHRKSIDLDLFGTLNADELSINKSLKKIGSVQLLNKTDTSNGNHTRQSQRILRRRQAGEGVRVIFDAGFGSRAARGQHEAERGSAKKEKFGRFHGGNLF